MKVLLINGSRREKQCTYTALSIIAEALREEGIESEILFAGERAANGQINELAREAAEKMKESDALIVGAPVYYASPSAEILMLLDRLFAIAGPDLVHKPGAAICSARRAGTSASLDVLNKYFLYSQMPLVASDYWNMVHGNQASDVLKDEEGVQIMRTLGKNMAWILRCIEAAKASGIAVPESPKKIFTNFIR